MRDVLDWVSQADSARDQLTSLLRRSREPGFVEEIGQFLATNDLTRTSITSITSTIMPALSWLTSPAAVRSATGAHPFDVAELLSSKATVYLPGAEETHTAPLVCALPGYVAREARRIAACQPSGRLDPPLTLALDEAGRADRPGAVGSVVSRHGWSGCVHHCGVPVPVAADRPLRGRPCGDDHQQRGRQGGLRWHRRSAALSHSLARTVTRDKAREAREADDAHRDIHEHDVAPVARQVIADQTAAERELEVVDIRDTEPDATEHTDPVERRRVPLPDEDARRVELARWADEAKQSDDRTAGQDRG